MVTPHELPTLVLYRKYSVKPAFPAGPDSLSFKDYRKQAQISRERASQLIQVRHQFQTLYLARTTEINLTFQQNVSVKGKRCFWAGKPTFSQGKMVLAWKNQPFPRKKMVLGRKNQLFPMENQNNIFWETMRPKSTKMFFFFLVFPFEKMVFLFSCPKPFLYRLILYKRLGNNQDILRIILGVNRKLVSQV